MSTRVGAFIIYCLLEEKRKRETECWLGMIVMRQDVYVNEVHFESKAVYLFFSVSKKKVQVAFKKISS